MADVDLGNGFPVLADITTLLTQMQDGIFSCQTDSAVTFPGASQQPPNSSFPSIPRVASLISTIRIAAFKIFFQFYFSHSLKICISAMHSIELSLRNGWQPTTICPVRIYFLLRAKFSYWPTSGQPAFPTN